MHSTVYRECSMKKHESPLYDITLVNVSKEMLSSTTGFTITVFAKRSLDL